MPVRVLGCRLRSGRRGDLTPQFGSAAWPPVGRPELGQLRPIRACRNDNRDVFVGERVDDYRHVTVHNSRQKTLRLSMIRRRYL